MSRGSKRRRIAQGKCYQSPILGQIHIEFTSCANSIDLWTRHLKLLGLFVLVIDNNLPVEKICWGCSQWAPRLSWIAMLSFYSRTNRSTRYGQDDDCVSHKPQVHCIMKLGVAFVTLILTVLHTLVVGQYGHVVILNDNKDDPPLKTCHGIDKTIISNAIQSAASARRLDGKGLAHTAKDEETNAAHGRKLTCPTGCGNYCWGSGTGCPTGKGGRRRTKESRAEESHRRRRAQEQERRAVQMSLSMCESKIPFISAALDAVQPSLAPPCRAVVRAPRNITCQIFTTDFQIEVVKMVNADKNAVVTNNVPTGGTSFCQSQGVSFMAGTAFIVGRVNFLVYGPSGTLYNHTATASPYYFNGQASLGPKGVNFPLGTYTMKITSEYDKFNSKTFVFTVDDC
jgi:hypothetical protein